MPRRKSKRSAEGGQQLPMLCRQCSGVIVELRGAEETVLYCPACEIDLARYPAISPEEEPLYRPLAAEKTRLRRVPANSRKLYRFIHRFLIEQGYPPSQRNMMEAMGWSSVGSVRHHLKQLEKEGLIQRDYATPRGIRLPHAA